MAKKKIRVLSVRQPYADQIICGEKWNELRSWKTPYRGTIYIHASRWDGAKSQDSPGPGTTGAIIGCVELVDCIFAEDLYAVQEHLHFKEPLDEWLEPLASYLKQFPRDTWEENGDKWNWILVEPKPLASPIPMLGKLNLWHTEVPNKKLRVRRTNAPQGCPLAKDYSPVTPPAVIFKPVTQPGAGFRRLLFKYLKKKKAVGSRMLPDVLETFAAEGNTSVGNLLAALKNADQFERVPGKPEKEEWWRVRQSPIEIRLDSRYKD